MATFRRPSGLSVNRMRLFLLRMLLTFLTTTSEQWCRRLLYDVLQMSEQNFLSDLPLNGIVHSRHFRSDREVILLKRLQTNINDCTRLSYDCHEISTSS